MPSRTSWKDLERILQDRLQAMPVANREMIKHRAIHNAMWRAAADKADQVSILPSEV
jgi:hypothetical protein